ncbi:hypothetical protein BC332_06781 [Capsicum chinense]|nr:hypothetical protein BC332_06781 [Capsicum chinense]
MEDHIFSHFNAILLLITITLSSIFIYKLTQKSHKLSNFQPEISGGLPVIGHLPQFSGADNTTLHRELSSWADKSGPIFTFRLGIPRILVVSSYDAVKDCLNINDKVFASRRGVWPEIISGALPTTSEIGSALRSFNLHGNKLAGKIPRSLENYRLEVVDLGDNLLNDTFPMWLGTLPELRVLSLRLNKLHGPIRTLGSGTMYLELRMLDLSSNAFTGNVPTSLFQHMNAMREIDPSKKAPSDEEDVYYQNSIAVVTKGMEVEVVRILFLYTTIDLSNNKFEGHIPSMIGELIALRVLNLSHNGLQGPIPQSLGCLSSVESLDLSGCIPQGNQFHTFENNSYEGNDGLRGFSLSRGCDNSTSEKTYAGSALDEESYSEFLNDFWKAALITGLCIGLSIIYIYLDLNWKYEMA